MMKATRLLAVMGVALICGTLAGPAQRGWATGRTGHPGDVAVAVGHEYCKSRSTGCANLRHLGDGRSNDAAAIQRAIDAVPGKGEAWSSSIAARFSQAP